MLAGVDDLEVRDAAEPVIGAPTDAIVRVFDAREAVTVLLIP